MRPSNDHKSQNPPIPQSAIPKALVRVSRNGVSIGQGQKLIDDPECGKNLELSNLCFKPAIMREIATDAAHFVYIIAPDARPRKTVAVFGSRGLEAIASAYESQKKHFQIINHIDR